MAAVSVKRSCFKIVATLNDMMAVGNLHSYAVNNLKLAYIRCLVISGFGFSQSFSTLEKLGSDSDPRLHDL